MPQRATPSQPFASAPNRAGPTRLFASVRQSLPTSTQERPTRRAANHTNEPGPDEGASLDAAAAHRAAGCHVAQNDARGEGDGPKDIICAHATAVQSLTASRDVLAERYSQQSPIGSSAHVNAADAGPDPQAIANFVELVHLRALLDSRPRGLQDAGCRFAKRLQHDHVLVEARWRAGVIARCQGRREAKLQSVVADTADATCPLAMKADDGSGGREPETASVRLHAQRSEGLRQDAWSVQESTGEFRNMS